MLRRGPLLVALFVFVTLSGGAVTAHDSSFTQTSGFFGSNVWYREEHATASDESCGITYEERNAEFHQGPHDYTLTTREDCTSRDGATGCHTQLVELTVNDNVAGNRYLIRYQSIRDSCGVDCESHVGLFHGTGSPPVHRQDLDCESTGALPTEVFWTMSRFLPEGHWSAGSLPAALVEALLDAVGCIHVSHPVCAHE